MALILRVNGKKEDMIPKGSEFTLTIEQLQQAVGGYIEQVIVPHSHNVLLVDEDGYSKELPVNIQASKLAQRQIVGDAVLCVLKNENYL